MGITPAEDVYLKSAHKAKTLLPIFPLPRHLIREDCVYGHFSHFNRHFPGRLSLRGQRSISHILTGAFSYCQLPQQRPNGPVQGLLRGPAEGPWRLISVWPARCKQRWASATLTVKRLHRQYFHPVKLFIRYFLWIQPLKRFLETSSLEQLYYLSYTYY